MPDFVSNAIGIIDVGWMTTIIVFVIVIITIFLISKNIRKIIYGGIISGIILINYKFSRWIGNATIENNYEPIKWFFYVIGFIIVSIIIGFFVQKLKFIQDFEKKLLDEKR